MSQWLSSLVWGTTSTSQDREKHETKKSKESLLKAIGGVGKKVIEIQNQISDLEAKIDPLVIQLKQARANPIRQREIKARAAPLIKRKIHLEKQLRIKEGQLDNLRNQYEQFENVEQTVIVSSALKEGVAASKRTLSQIDEEEIKDLRHDMAESASTLDEVNDLLSSPFSESDRYLEYELEEYFDDMQLDGDDAGAIAESPIPSGTRSVMPSTRKSVPEEIDLSEKDDVVASYVEKKSSRTEKVLQEL